MKIVVWFPDSDEIKMGLEKRAKKAEGARGGLSIYNFCTHLPFLLKSSWPQDRSAKID